MLSVRSQELGECEGGVCESAYDDYDDFDIEEDIYDDEGVLDPAPAPSGTKATFFNDGDATLAVWWEDPATYARTQLVGPALFRIRPGSLRLRDPGGSQATIAARSSLDFNTFEGHKFILMDGPEEAGTAVISPAVGSLPRAGWKCALRRTKLSADRIRCHSKASIASSTRRVPQGKRKTLPLSRGNVRPC